MKKKDDSTSIQTNTKALLEHEPIDASENYPTKDLAHIHQVYQLELELQNEELRRTQSALEESRNCYLDLFENAPVAYLVLTKQGLIKQANFTSAELLGFERNKLITRRFAGLVSVKDCEYWHLFFAHILKYKQCMNIKLAIKGKDNCEFPAQLNCTFVDSLLRITLTNLSSIQQLESNTDPIAFDRSANIEEERLLIVEIQNEAHTRLHEISNALPGVIYQFLMNPDGSCCFPYASQAMADIYRLDPEEVKDDASKVFNLIHPDDYEEVYKSIQISAQNLTPWFFEYRVKFEDDSVRWLRGNSLPQKESHGATLWHGFITDITENKRHHQTLNQLEAMVDISLDGFWINDLQGNIIKVNPGYSKIIGYLPDELVGMHISQLEVIEDNQSVKAHIDKVINLGFDHFETRHRHKLGHVIDIEISVAYLSEFEQFSVFCRDISQRKLFEQELKVSELKSRSIIDLSPVPMALIDKHSNIVFLNSMFVQTFGYELEDIPTLEAWWPKAYPNAEYSKWVQTNWKIIQEDITHECNELIPLEVLICCKNKQNKTVLASNANLDHLSNGMSLIILYDITWRKHFESKFNSIFNASVEGIITVNLNSMITTANPSVERIFGYKLQELLDTKATKLIPLIAKIHTIKRYSFTSNAISEVIEIEGLHKNGTVMYLDLTIAEYQIDNSRFFTYIVRDVSLRKYREQLDQEHLDQLAHVTRLGLMGEMASSLAHEVNQPLSAIATYAQVCLNLINKENPDLQKLSEVIVKTKEQALRAGQIIHRMKNFCKSKSHQRSTTDINSLINECVSLCADALKHNNITLNLDLEENLPTIHVDHIQIEQVLLNFIRNSIDAFDNNTKEQPLQITIRSHLTARYEIIVQVKDNGPGIEIEQQQKILMPFYTTKTNGMGMGLSISRSLIEAHNGVLNFESEPGKGTTFYFTLPIELK